ncbi:MAG: hypothetical protein ABIH65_00330 [Nanoarchaeota archaeon]
MAENLENGAKEFYKIHPNPDLIPLYGIYRHAKRCGENAKSIKELINPLKRSLGIIVCNDILFSIGYLLLK